MQRLPAELTDIIIHHSDRPTLKVCSLVCRNWLPASRFHLFGSVFVFRSNIRTFVELLASRSSTIASHVHTLHINILVFDTIAPHFEDFVTLNSVSLLLQGGNWVPVMEKNLSMVFGGIGNMELTSVYCNLDISWFNLTFTLGESGPSSTLRALPSHIYGFEASWWLPIVVRFSFVGQLEFRDIQKRHLRTVRAVLKSGGQFIHTIILNFSIGPPCLALISDCVDLTRNTNLRSLYISTLHLRNSEEIPSHGAFLKIIQRISSPFFSHITIGAEVNSWADLTRLECENVADELNHPRFSEFQKMCVTIRCFHDKRDGVTAWLRREMSCLDNRGILTVTFRD